MEEKTLAQDGLRLKEFRKFKKISQKELADILGCSQPNLSKIENGELGVSKAISERLFNEYLDLNPTWLLLGGGKMLQGRSDQTLQIPAISLDNYSERTIEDAEKQFQDLQFLIGQGKVPLPAISSIIITLREILRVQHQIINELKSDKKFLKEIIVSSIDSPFTKE